ncbi:sugar phosphate isomerase/epimerase [Paenibacillus sp. TRM 82003]|nr:sugar phosphate isomerase/epimerase [Paenibacillus sp. TRM 82003]
MIEEIASLGFRRVELNYNVTTELLKEIEPMIERGEIGVSSVHNTFPFIADPDYGTDSVLLGFADEERRAKAVELLVNSAAYAHRYGAKAVVVHPGEVPMKDNFDSALKKLFREQGPDSKDYRSLWAEMLERRESGAGAVADRIVRSLEEACERIERRGYDVAIGIETRARCHQIPSLPEAKAILDRLQGAPVGLWYDIGHGIMMERMGLYENAKSATALKERIVGVHIHETIGLSDHWCPYVHSGDATYFDRFLSIIESAPIKVYELKSSCEPKDIEESHALLTDRMARQQLRGEEIT